MPAQMTTTAWNQGAKNALVIAGALLVIWCLTATAIAVLFRQTIVRSFGVAGAAICILALALFLVTWLNGRRGRGRILLDCGLHPTWWLFLLNAIIFLKLGIVSCLDSIFNWMDRPEATWPTILFRIGWPAIMILFVPFWLVMAAGRFQVREQGIWQYWGLLRWSKISWYRWSNDNTLILRATGIFSRLQGALPVPPEHKEAVAEFLIQNCPGALADEPGR